MRPPLTLDIGWLDLFAAAGACIAPRESESLVGVIEATWCPDGTAVVGLTARTLFDAWLRARAYPVGSEILFTGYTLPDMVRIAAANGCEPVCVDVDPRTMTPTVEELETLSTDRTRAVVVAHLFGGRNDLSAVARWASARGVDLVEDAAQAYAADGWRGDDRAAISLFSFGTIKTATALGGAIARVPDRGVRSRVRELLAEGSAQGRWEFARRVGRATLLRVLGKRPVYSAFVAGCRVVGRRHDAVLRRATRSIRMADLLAAIRRRPCASQLTLVLRRLQHPPAVRIRRRGARGEAVLRRLSEQVLVPGSTASVRTHWILPVCVDDRDRVAARLRAAGFDSAPAGSVAVIGDAPRLQRMESRLLHVPVSHRLTDREITRIADAIV